MKDKISELAGELELLKYFVFSRLSEDGLRGMIARHGLTQNNNLKISDNAVFFLACNNGAVDDGMIRCLLEYFPAAAVATDVEGCTLLHAACCSKNVSLDIIQLLIDAAPDSVRSMDNRGYMPLHCLCNNLPDIDEEAAMEILNLLLRKCPESIRHADNKGTLPIHFAAVTRAPEFCRVLIEAYLGSERISDDMGMLPLHLACWRNSLPTVEYLYNLYPDAINHAVEGFYPIHCAIMGLRQRNRADVDLVQFMLDCDPGVKLQKVDDCFLLHYACTLDYNYSNIDAGLQVIKAVYDAHPEAIEDNRFVSDIHRSHRKVQTFINEELSHARHDYRLRLKCDENGKLCELHRALQNRMRLCLFKQLMTPDENGQLPLHHALQNNVRLGSIKLLVKGNPSAIRSVDNNGALPLHLACEHHNFPGVVQYLLDLDKAALEAEDRDGNTALHNACRAARYGTIAMLLEEYDAVSVSKLNVHEKLPLDLLWESDEVEDRESEEYTDCVFRLLKAHPETLKNFE